MVVIFKLWKLWPLFSNKADVEFTPLQIFTRVAHDLIEGVLQ